MAYVVGVDIGTSSTRAVLFDTAGRQVASCAQPYALKSPVPGAAEQYADEILQATFQVVADVVAGSGISSGQLLGVSFSAAMHTLLLVDEADRPLTPMYTWADNRSDRWAEVAKQKDPQLYERTGLPAHPMSPVVKLMWLWDELPEVCAEAARVVSIKEYVLWHWCGEWVVDHSIASATGLLNLRALDWDGAAVSLAGIRREQLSALVPTMHVLAVQREPAQRMGIRDGLPVVVGASDGVLANVGVGAIAPGTAAITLGTSGAVRRVVNQPVTDSQAQLFCYALTEGRWVMGGAVNNGGIALQWARDSLVPYSVPLRTDLMDAEPRQSRSVRMTYARMTDMARAIAPGADGLIFHPYLLGERAPLWNAQARASFFGLGREHTQAHLVRAVMEGVIYNLHAVFEALVQAGGEVTTLRASGGFAQSDVWQQILADVCDRTVEIPAVIESSAFGAAGLALVALGEWESLEDVGERVAVAHTRSPIPENVRRYQKMLPIYAELSAGFIAQYEALQRAVKA